MGLFSNSDKETEEIRGVLDKDLKRLPDMPLLLLAMARLHEAQGVGDDALVDELRRRVVIYVER